MICNLTFVGEITKENALLCNYGNYHIFMLISCGLLSFGCVVRGVVLYTICRTPLYIVEREFFMGMLFFVFALGFEVAILLFCICIFLKPCKEEKVVPLEVIQVVIDDIHRESSLICPICLESNEDDDMDKWLITRCNHAFHDACIKGWVKNSCPICRKVLYI